MKYLVYRLNPPSSYTINIKPISHQHQKSGIGAGTPSAFVFYCLIIN